MTEKEKESAKAKEIARDIINKRKKSNQKDSVTKASNTIFLAMSVTMILTLQAIYLEADSTIKAILAGVTLTFGILGFLSKKSPLIPLVLAFLLYAIYAVFDLLLRGFTFVSVAIDLALLFHIGMGVFNAFKILTNKKKNTNSEIIDYN